MKYFIPMIILSLVLLSCAKEEEVETDTTMSTPLVSDGTYKLTAAIQKYIIAMERSMVLIHTRLVTIQV